MSISKNAKVSPEKLFALLFDDGVYTELLPSMSINGNMAEVKAVSGRVCGQNIYAYSQCDEGAGGAMSVAQAEKLKKVYALALKTGCPVVSFYTDSKAKVTEGNMLLDALGDLLASSMRLSGIVPRISVVMGDCVASNAMLSASADFVIMTEDAKLTLSGDCDCSGKGKAAIVAEDAQQAVDKVAELISYLPANNLSQVPFAEASDGLFFDADSELKLYDNKDDKVSIALARIDGRTVGSVKALSKEIDKKSAKKIASFVRFCDAFSLPVITQMDAAEFCCIGSANKVLSAYTEATTVKISVVEGTAVGAAYMALAGKAARCDAVIGMEGAVISPIKPEAAAYIALGTELEGLTVAEQDAKIKEYIANELSAENAAKNGFIDDVADSTNIRTKLVNYLSILGTKRETALPKKHSTI